MRQGYRWRCPDASRYAERAGNLYSNSVPQAIDYPVYSVSEKDGAVTVILSDARNPYVKKGLISTRFTGLCLTGK